MPARARRAPDARARSGSTRCSSPGSFSSSRARHRRAARRGACPRTDSAPSMRTAFRAAPRAAAASRERFRKMKPPQVSSATGTSEKFSFGHAASNCTKGAARSVPSSVVAPGVVRADDGGADAARNSGRGIRGVGQRRSCGSAGCRDGGRRCRRRAAPRRGRAARSRSRRRPRRAGSRPCRAAVRGARRRTTAE